MSSALSTNPPTPPWLPEPSGVLAPPAPHHPTAHSNPHPPTGKPIAADTVPPPTGRPNNPQTGTSCRLEIEKSGRWSRRHRRSRHRPRRPKSPPDHIPDGLRVRHRHAAAVLGHVTEGVDPQLYELIHLASPPSRRPDLVASATRSLQRLQGWGYSYGLHGKLTDVQPVHRAFDSEPDPVGKGTCGFRGASFARRVFVCRPDATLVRNFLGDRRRGEGGGAHSAL